MPNQNATKFKGKDPDPTDFLWPTMDMKKQNLQKPYVSQSMGICLSNGSIFICYLPGPKEVCVVS